LESAVDVNVDAVVDVLVADTLAAESFFFAAFFTSDSLYNVNMFLSYS